MRVYFTNLGCKLNQAEMEALARSFAAAGHTVCRRLEEADLHVVNTCTVTHVAARDSRKIARRGRRLNPTLRTVLTGCYVAAEPEAAERLPGVDLIVGNHDKERLLEHVERRFPELRRRATDHHASRGGAPLRDTVPGRGAAFASDAAPEERSSLPVPYVPLPFGNSRAAVKVEDGCNMRCAFCIIPFTRGRQRSRAPETVIEEVRGLVASGLEEIVITGVQISAYRSGATRLYELVRRLLAETPVPRLRLTSIAPWDFDQRLLDLVASGRLCRHFHLSLQSGCAATLRRMRRPYTPGVLAALLASLRRAVPGVAITTDVIVGFPGESDAEFEESLRFVGACRFAKVHAFPYSERPGTAAAEMADPVPQTARRERMARMLAVADEGQRAFWAARIGERAQVLWEREQEGRWLGTTDHYVRVRAVSGGAVEPGLGWARLTAVDGDAVEGEPLPRVAQRATA
ncbi:MAG: tRNA (N(6)-L-threonylcarbamoyladenosine(37)-C(2))-methylthiotransferase MtaB [Thermoanaerobaculia bacterium]